MSKRHPAACLGLFAIAVVLTSCSNEHAGPDLSGTWKAIGTVACAPSISLTVNESRSGALSGSGKATWPGACGLGSVSYGLSGDHQQPAVTAQLQSTVNADFLGWEQVAMSGTLSGTDSIKAELRLHGSTQVVTVTLVRQ